MKWRKICIEKLFTLERINIWSGSEYEKPIGFSRAVRIGNIISVTGPAPIAPDGTTDHPNTLISNKNVPGDNEKRDY
jgi:hypothetical protein